MSTRSQKPIVKKRQESVRSKAQDRSLRSKVESETAKDLTELEKEMFSIKITDLEEKLNRKNQLCSFLEDEKQFFEAEYESKKILKKESMSLLNKAYEDFHLELILLKSELSRIGTEKACQKKENVPLTKRVERLTNVEKKLKEKFEEAERNIEDISPLKSKLCKLQEQIDSKSDNFKSNISNLDIEFRSFVKRLQNKLNDIIERMIQDKSLKLQLLPVPYQALFESGMLGNVWFESVLETCEHLVQQNTKINEEMDQLMLEYKHVCEVSRNNFSAIVLANQAKMQFNEIDGKSYDNGGDLTIQKNEVLYNEKELHEQMKYLLELNNLSLHLEKHINYLQNKVGNLEKKLEEQEKIADTSDEDFQLQLIISQAKDILTHEL
ncbi:hypothetical protein JTE90_010748 [Oedothorax gibbosus]|uniref:Uncharacterized protein n=1 Tax=Oedothorax gibbosus TaxID=931172 RepID=A0AAV6UDC3_9ARAC|nr:hypothetical protein JTE90_010748 [Oedothorax gibbosus]